VCFAMWSDLVSSRRSHTSNASSPAADTKNYSTLQLTLRLGRTCFCLPEDALQGELVDDSECFLPCPGNASEICGGYAT
jgi:hypothetical protein